jgi:hypothetical protein
VKRGLVVELLLLAVCVLFVAYSPMPTDARQKESKRRRDATFDALIDQLANRVNTAPQIVERESLYGYHSVPLFDEEYDGAEQQRVFRVLRTLSASDGNKLWPRLVAHFDDERYAFTCSDAQGCTHNVTVGQMCHELAFGDLTLAFLQHSPRNPKARSVATRWLVRKPEWDAETLRMWLDERKDKQFYELQIDLCEWSITADGALERLSAAQRLEFIQQVQDQVETLRTTREPVTDKKRFNKEWRRLFSDEKIKQLRDDFEHPERPRAPDGPPMPPASVPIQKDKNSPANGPAKLK